MKDYIIWMKSGECISGTAKEETISDMQYRFGNYQDEDIKLMFTDEDGTVVVDLSRVEAIAINKQSAINKIGF